MILFVIAVSALLTAAGIAEYRIHTSRLKKIHVRILVNGTRGKSTVTRLIASGLVEGGLRVCAKTTGSAARFILPDLSEEPIRRRKGVSIMEHAWFVRRSVGLGAQAIVAECMAIQPETIRTLERRLARSTIGVITNVRADHMDTMGAELGKVAETLALSVPERGKVFVGAEGMDEGLKTVFARAIAPNFIVADDAARALCTRFGYPMFAENLALALAVCEECGVGREVALRGMLKGQPDPGVRASTAFEWRGIRVRAVNAFAANDVKSTLELWRGELSSLNGVEESLHRVASDASGARDHNENSRILVFNHRDDRSWRAFQLAEIAEGIGADAILVFGMSEWLARRLARNNGAVVADSGKPGSTSRRRLIRALGTSESSVEAVLAAALGMLSRRPARIEILCAGNIKGPGMALTESLERMRVSGTGRI